MIPLLAKTCEMDGNNETWVVELDDSYVWSDGTAVTSADVIWSLEKISSWMWIWDRSRARKL
jgi:ABC-type transport system substrate-binding protein